MFFVVLFLCRSSCESFSLSEAWWRTWLDLRVHVQGSPGADSQVHGCDGGPEKKEEEMSGSLAISGYSEKASGSFDCIVLYCF